MKPDTTVKENYLFRRIYRKGASAVEPSLVVYCQKNRKGQTRLGVTVSTKLGKAVVRNHLRRQMRELWRTHKTEMCPGYDVIVVVRVRATRTPYAVLERQYLDALTKLSLLEKPT